MRTIALALVAAFAAATRLTALEAKLDSSTVKPPHDTKPIIEDIKPIEKVEKPLDLKVPGEVKKEETLEDHKDEGSKSFGG